MDGFFAEKVKFNQKKLLFILFFYEKKKGEICPTTSKRVLKRKGDSFTPSTNDTLVFIIIIILFGYCRYSLSLFFIFTLLSDFSLFFFYPDYYNSIVYICLFALH